MGELVSCKAYSLTLFHISLQRGHMVATEGSVLDASAAVLCLLYYLHVIDLYSDNVLYKMCQLEVFRLSFVEQGRRKMIWFRGLKLLI